MRKKLSNDEIQTKTEKRLSRAEELTKLISISENAEDSEDTPFDEDCDDDDFWDDMDDEDDYDSDDYYDDDDLIDEPDTENGKSSTEEIPFYDARYTPQAPCVKKDTEANVNLKNPQAIYNYLREHVYKQDEYCKAAAMILYNHINGHTSANMVCGPAGCGKTHVWECLREIYPKIIIVNTATVTKEGWKGENKVTSFLSLVDFEEPDYIVVFDEFDKCAAPQYASGGENVSASVMSEFLKLVEGDLVSTRRDGLGEIKIDTTPMSFVFCGSFAIKANEIAEKKSSNGFGFENKRTEVKSFADKLTIQDLIDFGVIPELASRISRIVNVRPLTLEDYCYLLSKHPASPVKKMEKQYDMKLRLSKKKCEEIAKKAFESGLGIRNATAQLQSIIDKRIFDKFKAEEVNAYDH